MNILIIGSGGREHAFAWKIRQSSLCGDLFIAPGNAGTSECGTNVDIKQTDFKALASFSLSHNIDLILVGPEEPLVKGIYDYFKNDPKTSQIHVVGPSAKAALLEGSKSFAKEFMERNNIPTAAYKEFEAHNYNEGVDYIRKHQLPIVLKADGLAAGKGVIICQSHLEALAEFELMLQQSKFGDAGKKVVVEEFLDGIELSVFVLTDGKYYVILPEAKDYKRIGVGDTGLNTGGMGAVSPVPFADELFMNKVKSRIIEPTIQGFQKENLDYRGFVFIGLIKVGNEPLVIEYNCRMGDPETEVVIPRLKNDLLLIFEAMSRQRLNDVLIETEELAAVTVVAVSGGYPNKYENGKEIEGLEDAGMNDTIIFHSGTKIASNGKVVTNGGRVLAVTSYGDDILGAAEQSAYVLEQIYFNGKYFREDIGYEFTK